MSNRTNGELVVSSSFIICTRDAKIVANCMPHPELGDLAIPFDEADANAKFIKKAWNYHDRLVEALKKVTVRGCACPTCNERKELLSEIESD
jgi:hypothetical protein